jgi:hypothetical protein
MTRLAAKQAFDAFAADPVSETLVVQRIAEGETLVEICRSLELPYSLVAQWIVEDAERVRQYDGALALWADAEAQRCIAVADGATPEDVAVAKLRISTRLSLAGKWDRRRYGEHTKVEHSGTVTSLIQVLASLPGPHERDVTPQVPQLTEQPIDVVPVIATHAIGPAPAQHEEI